MIHYSLLPGYVPSTYHKNNIVTLFVTSILYYRNITCLLEFFIGLKTLRVFEEVRRSFFAHS